MGPKFNILFLHKPFSVFYKGNRGQIEEVYTDLKNLHKHGLRVCRFFHVCNSPTYASDRAQDRPLKGRRNFCLSQMILWWTHLWSSIFFPQMKLFIQQRYRWPPHRNLKNPNMLSQCGKQSCQIWSTLRTRETFEKVWFHN